MERKSRKHIKPKPNPKVNRRGFFTQIGKNKFVKALRIGIKAAQGKPYVGPLIKRRTILKTGLTTLGLVGAYKLGLTPKIEALPVWFGFHKKYKMLFGFTTHTMLGTKKFIELIDKAKKQGKPFHWIFFENARMSKKERKEQDKITNENLKNLKRKFDEKVRRIGKRKATDWAKREIRKFLISSEPSTVEIYFKAMIEGIQIRNIEFHDEELLEKLREIERQSSYDLDDNAENPIFDNIKRVKRYMELKKKSIELRDKSIAKNIKQILEELPNPYWHGQQRSLVYFGEMHSFMLDRLEESERQYIESTNIAEKNFFSELMRRYYNGEKLSDLDYSRLIVYIMIIEPLTIIRRRQDSGMQIIEHVEKYLPQLSQKALERLNKNLKGKNRIETFSIIFNELGVRNKIIGNDLFFY